MRFAYNGTLSTYTGSCLCTCHRADLRQPASTAVDGGQRLDTPTLLRVQEADDIEIQLHRPSKTPNTSDFAAMDLGEAGDSPWGGN